MSKQGLLCRQRTRKLDFCEHCVFRKQCRVKFNTTVHKTKGTMDYIDLDFYGPLRVPSHSGGKYVVTFIDDYSRKVRVFVLKHKDKVFAMFKQ